MKKIIELTAFELEEILINYFQTQGFDAEVIGHKIKVDPSCKTSWSNTRLEKIIVELKERNVML